MEIHLLIALGATMVHLAFKDKLFYTELTKKGIMNQLKNVVSSILTTIFLHWVLELLLKQYHETQPTWFIIGSFVIGLLGSGIMSGILAVDIQSVTQRFFQNYVNKVLDNTPKGDSTP